MLYHVYSIINPIDGKPFYIGYSGRYELRKKQHLDGTDLISGQIIRQIKYNGFVPLFVTLEEHEEEETALRAEIFWIETMLARSVALVNSQAFTGWEDRQRTRGIETTKADRMEELKKVANGRTAKRTGAKPEIADDWSTLDTKRLMGMKKKGFKLPAMARMLDRTQGDVSEKLRRERLLQDQTSEAHEACV